MNGRQWAWIAIGRYYGYPECCIAQFAQYAAMGPTNWAYPENPWRGTGFIPCIDCALKALDFRKFVAECITPNRKCPTPFPEQQSGPAADLVLDKVVDDFDVETFKMPERKPGRYIYRPLQPYAFSGAYE